MTLMELFGCSLVTFSPALVMFIFTIARHPLKIIILTCSSFFWLLSLLLSSVVWYAIVPLRQELAFGMVVSVIFQEAVRVGFYYFLKRAEAGLQKIAIAEETQAAADSVADPGANSEADATAAPNSAISSVAEASSQQGSTAADRVVLTPAAASRSSRILNLHSLSYVCGLGFGFMSGAFAMVNLLADMSGPATVGLSGEHEAFLFVSASLALLFVCLNICWTVVTFVCLEDRKLFALPVVWATHMLCSLLTLLNHPSEPLLSLAPAVTALVSLLTCLLLCLTLLGISIPRFFLSLVSPAWICALRSGSG